MGHAEGWPCRSRCLKLETVLLPPLHVNADHGIGEFALETCGISVVDGHHHGTTVWQGDAPDLALAEGEVGNKVILLPSEPFQVGPKGKLLDRDMHFFLGLETLRNASGLPLRTFVNLLE